MAAPKTTLQRLLRYPHGVFDRRPQAELAIRIRHIAGCAWTVADEVLTLSVAGGAEVHTYDLTDRTLVQLAMDVVDDGFEVPYLSPTLRSLGAAVLVEGAGDQDRSNGDHLQAFTSLLWVVLSAYAREIREAGVQREEALRQMVIPQAEGYWLDVWGQLYGIGREAGETDGQYAPRIPEEAFRLRVNALAIEKAILDLTGMDVRIREPWRNMFRLNESRLSGSDRLYDGSNYGYHLLQPVSMSTDVDWARVIPIIHRNRPAGVQVLRPRMELSTWVDGRLRGNVWAGGRTAYVTRASAWQNVALGWMVLDQDDLVRNYRVVSLAVRSMTNRLGMTWKKAGGTWDKRRWRMSGAALDLAGVVSAASMQVRGEFVSAGEDFGVVTRVHPPDVRGAVVDATLPDDAHAAGTALRPASVDAMLDGSIFARGRDAPGTWADGGTWDPTKTWAGRDIPMD